MNFYVKQCFSFLLKVAMIFALVVTAYVNAASTPASAAGFGQWVSLDKQWKYRVDAPLSDGGSENKYHVHVEGKVGKKVVKGAETVDGKTSHKTTLDKSGVPKSIQKKVKATAEFKKGVAKQKELDKAKADAKTKSWSQLVFDPTPIIVIAGIIGISFYAMSMSKWKSFIFG